MYLALIPAACPQGDQLNTLGILASTGQRSVPARGSQGWCGRFNPNFLQFYGLRVLGFRDNPAVLWFKVLRV